LKRFTTPKITGNVQNISQSYCNTSPYLTTILNGNVDIDLVIPFDGNKVAGYFICVYDIQLVRKSINALLLLTKAQYNLK
jgi:hypothetical protein